MKSEHELEELTPRRIVEELDKFIVGQADAKRVVAIALRNRTRRRRLEDGLREEVIPKNIIMIGPTGVGKTEIARRMARLVKAPFVKVEATKYTEVGYVGRDVESMVRDLIETSISMVREEMIEDVNAEAQRKVRARLLKLPARQSRLSRRNSTPSRPKKWPGASMRASWSSMRSSSKSPAGRRPKGCSGSPESTSNR